MEDVFDNVVCWNKVEFGVVVLIKIDIGEILVMVSYLDFNLNNCDSVMLDDFCNWVISDIFEFGLMVKLLVIMIVLQQGIVQLDSVVDIYLFVFDGYCICDVGYYLELSLIGILQKFSDIGVFYFLFVMLVQYLIDIYKVFGFGELMGLGLIGESVGLMLYCCYWG